jgi:NADPH:quinone reductase-like Zn-dependent oxidoreductase
MRPPAGQQPEGTVLIKVIAASLNAIDVALAGGTAAGTMTHRSPLVVDPDAAGVAEAVGAIEADTVRSMICKAR